LMSKSATADFDARVSKDGNRPQHVWPSFETPCCARLLRMRFVGLSSIPSDVIGFTETIH
jgi:hypothetical protein